jgi:hypothetical protein
MIKAKHLLSLVAILIIAGLSSCHKDDPKPLSKTDLISRTWKVTGTTVNGIDIFSSTPACQKDDLWKFTKNGTITFDEGATKCDPSDPQTETSNWSFTENETKIKLTSLDGSSTETDTLTELTATTLKISTVDTSTGTPITLVLIFSPQ